MSQIYDTKCTLCSKTFKTTNPDAELCLKCADKAAKKAAAKMTDAPHIETRLMIGGVGYPVDASSLERTLGAGQYGHGLGLVDSWPDAAWVGILTHADLPADPLDRAVAGPTVKRTVQRLWYMAVKGGIPEERTTVFTERDAAARQVYAESFADVKVKTETRKERARATGFGRKGETRYAPTVVMTDTKFNPPGGQAALLYTFFKNSGFKSASTQEATAGMIAAGLKTTTKPERIAAFYLCQFAKKGLLDRATA